MNGFRENILSLIAVLAVPLAFVAVFPLEAVSFAPSDGARASQAPSAAIVILDSDAVARAMRTTRILSRHERGGDAAVVDLLTVDLPGAEAAPVMPIEARGRAATPTVVGGGIPPFLPSRRAAAPVRISVEAAADALPFPRKELLMLN